MKVSRNWLSEYLDIKKFSTADLAAALTDSGLEVETIETVSQITGDVLVGEVLSAEKHPDADALRVCQVSVGKGDPLNIVCGAPNARAGIKVCVATVGSCLPGDFKIKKSKIRGVVSEGMLCAADELGISNDHDTIIELPENSVLGESIPALFQLNDDVLTLGITPNRGDCLGVIGVARDLGAKLGIPLKYPQSDAHQSTLTKSAVQPSVTIERADDCARFTARRIDQLKVAPSPKWLQQRLQQCDVRPINNIVDVTNYVMLEFGQPIHAYDSGAVHNSEFHVRRAKAAESFVTLDGQTRTLSGDDLVIADSKGILGLAGVMGGQSSEVSDTTTSIIVEVANFSPQLVRKTAKRLALHSEASHRFERGCDAAVCTAVQDRVAHLLVNVATELGHQPPKVDDAIADNYPGKRELLKIALRVTRTRQILGSLTIDVAKLVEKLTALGFVLLDQTADRERLLWSVPAWRSDIQREIDLIEEAGRMLGYVNIPYLLPHVEMGGLKENPFIDFADRAKEQFARLGATEIISFPFVGDQEIKQMRLDDAHPLAQSVRLKNPLAETEQRMRTSMLFGLIKACQTNRRQGRKGGVLFESGRCFFRTATSGAATSYVESLQRFGMHMNERAKSEQRCVEANVLGFLIDQPLMPKRWTNQAEVPADFYAAKTLVCDFLGSYAIAEGSLSFTAISPTELPFLHPHASALIYVHQKLVGYCGELHPKTASQCDWQAKAPAVVGEILLDTLFGLSQRGFKVVDSEQPYPPLALDLAFTVDEKVSYKDVSDAVRNFKGKRFLSNLEIFDVYRGSNLQPGKKSMAFAALFISNKKTLSDKDVEPELEGLKTWLKESIGAEQR